MLVIPDALREFEGMTSEKHRADIDRLHGGDFARHVLTCEEPGLWLCAEPGTVNQSFRVAFLPGAVLIYGDIGDMLLRPYCNSSLGWLRGALNNGNTEHFGYLFEKVPREHRHMEFMPGDVIDACREAYEEGENGAVQDAIDIWGDTEGDWPSWCDAASQSDLDCDWGSGFEDYGAGMYWCALGLRWFVRAYEDIAKNG